MCEIKRAGFTPMARHFWWKQSLLLEVEDPGVDEHAFLSELLQLAVVYDQLNLGCLASFEAVARRYQIHEEMYAQEMDRKQMGEIDWAGERALLAGSSLNHYGCLVSPDLKEWIATEVSKKAAILKERRKAREERLFAQGAPAAVQPTETSPAAGGKLRRGRGKT